MIVENFSAKSERNAGIMNSKVNEIRVQSKPYEFAVLVDSC